MFSRIFGQIGAAILLTGRGTQALAVILNNEDNGQLPNGGHHGQTQLGPAFRGFASDVPMNQAVALFQKDLDRAVDQSVHLAFPGVVFSHPRKQALKKA